MEKKYRGHVILMPFPVQGHINPMLQFAKRLISKGLKATLATSIYTVKSVSDPKVSVEPISDGFDIAGMAQAGDPALFIESFKVNGTRTLSEIIRKYQTTDFPVTCLVYDSFTPWGLDVARGFGVYGAAFFTNMAANCCVFSAVQQGIVKLPIEIEDEPFCLDGIPALNYIDLPTFLTRHDLPAYLAMQISQFSNFDKADCLLVNSIEELESKDGKFKSELFPAKFIGPTVPSAYLDGLIEGDNGYGANFWKPLDKECTEWLETKEAQSVVFVSFGSLAPMAAKQMVEVAFGLKESNHYFLWVVRDVDRDKLPDGYSESIQDKGLIVPWCNQLEVLSHQAIGCFLTHCGWNSTLEALSIGVPMVGVPQWSDQFIDAKYVDEIWGVGVWAKEDEEKLVRRDEIVRCLKEVKEGDRSKEIKENVKKWKEVAKEAISEGGSSDKSINEFLDEVMRSV